MHHNTIDGTVVGDFDTDVQRAISEPRISFIEPNPIAADAGYDFFVDEYGLGNTHGLTIEYGEGDDRSASPEEPTLGPKASPPVFESAIEPPYERAGKAIAGV